jgi:predicted permease
MNDLTLAWRRLRRSPRFTTAVAVTLAVGVGGVAGIFALVHGVLLRPLPYPESDRLVVVSHTAPGLGLAEAGHSYGTWRHYRSLSRMLQDLAVYNENVVDLSDGGEPERVRVAITTASLFSVLGVAPALGRPFVSADGLPDAPKDVVILGHDLWARRYGADPGIIGRTVELNRASKVVVGVMPPGFGFPRPETEVWYPQEFEQGGADLARLFLSGIARLAPGASAESATRELNQLIPRLADAYGDVTRSSLAEARLAARVEPLLEATLGDLSDVLWLILAAMGLVLAIAGANVTNLFLVRAEERRVEIAVRAALGAGGGERVRTFMTEGALLGALAGVLAVPVAVALVRGVLAFGPADLPRLHEVTFGWPSALLTLGTATLLGAVLGAVRLLRGAERDDRHKGLRVDPRAAGGPRQRRAMQLLTVGEIAVGFTLLAGSALLLQSFWRLRAVDPGFDSGRVLTTELDLPYSPYRPGEAQVQFWHDLLDRVRALPGVESVGSANGLPLTPDWGSPFLREPLAVENAPATGDALPTVALITVTPGYFETLRIPVLAGRLPDDWSSPRLTAVVSAAFARRYLTGRNPLDARLGPVRDYWKDVPWHTVTAVVGDVRADGLAADPPPVIYLPVSDAHPSTPSAGRVTWPSHMRLVIRTTVPPLSLATAVRAIVRELDPRLPVAPAQTMEDIVARATAPTRFMMLALILAASVALLLASVGTYGLVAYVVSRRTRELGVRIALGATGAGVRALFLRQGATLAAAGVAAGVAISLTLGWVLQASLYELEASDPMTLVGAALFLFLVVLLAVDLPARRAARVDPMEALRYE